MDDTSLSEKQVEEEVTVLEKGLGLERPRVADDDSGLLYADVGEDKIDGIARGQRIYPASRKSKDRYVDLGVSRRGKDRQSLSVDLGVFKKPKDKIGLPGDIQGSRKPKDKIGLPVDLEELVKPKDRASFPVDLKGKPEDKTSLSVDLGVLIKEKETPEADNGNPTAMQVEEIVTPTPNGDEEIVSTTPNGDEEIVSTTPDLDGDKMNSTPRVEEVIGKGTTKEPSEDQLKDKETSEEGDASKEGKASKKGKASEEGDVSKEGKASKEGDVSKEGEEEGEKGTSEEESQIKKGKPSLKTLLEKVRPGGKGKTKEGRPPKKGKTKEERRLEEATSDEEGPLDEGTYELSKLIEKVRSNDSRPIGDEKPEDEIPMKKGMIKEGGLVEKGPNGKDAIKNGGEKGEGATIVESDDKGSKGSRRGGKVTSNDEDKTGGKKNQKPEDKGTDRKARKKVKGTASDWGGEDDITAVDVDELISMLGNDEDWVNDYGNPTRARDQEESSVTDPSSGIQEEISTISTSTIEGEILDDDLINQTAQNLLEKQYEMNLIELRDLIMSWILDGIAHTRQNLKSAWNGRDEYILLKEEDEEMQDVVEEDESQDEAAQEDNSRLNQRETRSKGSQINTHKIPGE